MTNYSHDPRVVLTLDAGGTNFVFSALRSNQEIIEPVRLPSNADNLPRCLQTLTQGFQAVLQKLPADALPAAISFAFPDPADYVHGVIGDLPNLPAFRGGIPLGGYLEEQFHLPVFINNDGNLYAYGEALGGFLPHLNQRLAEQGSPRRYQNLIGITLGPGLGAGVVINGTLLRGDNDCGGNIWCFRDKYHTDMIAEESVSIHAIKRMYKEFSGEDRPELTPKDICQIANQEAEGNQEAALSTFRHFGRGLGHALAFALNLVDGAVVIGGGVSAAYPLFMPDLLDELNGTLNRFDASPVGRLIAEAVYIDEKSDAKALLEGQTTYVRIPESTKTVLYNSTKKIPVAISSIDTSFAINLGAYNFALNELDKAKN